MIVDMEKELTKKDEELEKLKGYNSRGADRGKLMISGWTLTGSLQSYMNLKS